MTETKTITPPVDIFETAESYTAVFDLPGAKKEDIDVAVEEGNLVVTAKVVRDEEKAVSQEYVSGNYRRVLDLSNRVAVEGITAAYESGVLTLTLPKNENALPRKIAVNG